VSASARADPTRRSPRNPGVLGGLRSETGPAAPCVVALIGDRRVGVDPRAPVDARIRAIAGSQRGRARRDQLLAAGIKPGAITRRLANGRLEHIHRGVYGLPHTSDLPLAAEAAALLACGPAALLSHHSAATLWGLRPGIARPVHVTVPGDRGCPAPSGVIVHRSINLSPADREISGGLPVTSPARTLLDVARTLPDRDLERLLDEGLFARRILSLPQVNDVVARAGGHPGRARLARIAAGHSRPTRTESRPAETLFALIRAAGLPEPRTEFPVLDYRLDFYWPELGLAVEVDGSTHRSPARFEADRRRDARLLTEQGIVVLRVTWTAIEQRPLEVVGLIARAIGQREAVLRCVVP